MVDWLIHRSGEFRYIKGEPKSYKSETGATWNFCGICGTTLTYKGQDYGDSIDISCASIDDSDGIVPEEDANTDEKLPWLTLAPRPKY